MDVGFVTTKGQLVYPFKLRKRFRIKPGTRINFFEEKTELNYSCDT